MFCTYAKVKKCGMTDTRLSQRYNTRSRGALEVLFDISMSMFKECDSAYFELHEQILCIVVDTLCRVLIKDSSSNKRWRSEGSTEASMKELRKSCECTEASKQAAKDSHTSRLASKDEGLSAIPREIRELRRCTSLCVF